MGEAIMRGIHPYLDQWRRSQIAQLPGGMIDYSTTQRNLAVVGIENKDEEGCRIYKALLESGDIVKLDSASTFAKRWKGNSYFGHSDAARIGTDVHTLIENKLAGTDDEYIYVKLMQDEQVKHCFSLFCDWWSGCYDLEVFGTEMAVWSVTCGLAGRLDGLFWNSKLSQFELVDPKTTSFVSEQYRLQQAIYAVCLESVGIHVRKATLLMLPKPNQGDDWHEEVLWDTTERGLFRFANLRMAIWSMLQTQCSLELEKLDPVKNASSIASIAERLTLASGSLFSVPPALPSDTQRLLLQKQVNPLSESRC